jgi:membrane peptidoglycan carboxypeptidase
MTRKERFALRRLRARRTSRRYSNLPPFLAASLIATAFLALTIIGTGVAATAYVTYVGSTMDTPEERLAARGGGARIFDRNGVLLYQFLDERYGYQEPVPLGQISPHVRDATIAAEDASFYDNSGLNVRGIARAAVENFASGDILEGSGGSSITQQLAKQLYFSQEEREQRSVSRKMREAAIALQLTNDYDKDQILEWYLNEIPYGGVMIGVQAAAQGYFGIDARDLSLAQAAFLAGLPQSPSRHDPFTNFDAAVTRQREVLDLMVRHGKIDAETAAWAKLEVITVSPRQLPFHAPHFVQYVGEYIKATLGEEALYRGGLQVTTSLDLGMQWMANATLEKYVSTFERASNGHNGAVVIIEPPTGQILAMVGSRDYFRDDVHGRVNNAIAQNSPGSTLKPFTYATAFMQGWGPDWPIIDTTIRYREDDGRSSRRATRTAARTAPSRSSRRSATPTTSPPSRRSS